MALYSLDRFQRYRIGMWLASLNAIAARPKGDAENSDQAGDDNRYKPLHRVAPTSYVSMNRANNDPSYSDSNSLYKAVSPVRYELCSHGFSEIESPD